MHSMLMKYEAQRFYAIFYLNMLNSFPLKKGNKVNKFQFTIKGD